MKRVYISGPMRGIPRNNFPAFDRADQELRALGFITFNPADADRLYGITEFTTDLGEQELRECFCRDCSAICTCTHIALLEGWERSAGVRPEAILAHTLGLKFLLESQGWDEVDPLEVCGQIGSWYTKEFLVRSIA